MLLRRSAIISPCSHQFRETQIPMNGPHVAGLTGSCYTHALGQVPYAGPREHEYALDGKWTSRSGLEFRPWRRVLHFTHITVTGNLSQRLLPVLVNNICVFMNKGHVCNR